MTTRAPTHRAVELPDLVGVKADEAIQRLRELGLMPIPWSAPVADVSEAGLVLGLDPPAGSPVRPKASITMSVAAHPDFKGHAADTLDALPDAPVQTPLTWPLSSPTGFSAADPAPTSEALTDAFATAAAPGAPSAPASPPLDAAYREIRHDAAASSSGGQPTPGVAADPYLLDVSAPVPTPDEISGDAEWDRLRDAEAARHAAGQAFAPEAEPTALQPAVGADGDGASPDSAEALEEQARREARRRSARRHRRLTRTQKLIVGGVLALTLFIAAAAMSGHKPLVRPPATAHLAARRATPPAHTPAAVGHKRPQAHKPRVIVRWRTRTRVVRVKVHTPAPSNSQGHGSAPSNSASAVPATATPSNTGAGVAPSSGAPPSTPVASTPSHQPASTPSSADSRSSGTGGGSRLQSPDGSTAPPQP